MASRARTTINSVRTRPSRAPVFIDQVDGPWHFPTKGDIATSLIIRPVTESDLVAILSWWTNPEVMGAVRAERFHVTMDDLSNRYWPRWKSAGGRDFHQFIIELRGRAVGEIGYQMIDESLRTARLSVKIGETELWGRGLGLEATRWMCDYLFRDKKVESVEADPGDWNTRSLRILEKLEFREVERVPFAATAIHNSGVSVRMRLTREDWLTSHVPIGPSREVPSL